MTIENPALFLLLSFLVVVPSSSTASTLDTTYGAVLFCAQDPRSPLKVKGFYTLDYFETKNKYRLTPRLPSASGRDPFRILGNLTERLPMSYIKLRAMIEKRLKTFFLEVVFFQGEFVDPDFAEFEGTPANCRQQQLSLQKMPTARSYNKPYTMNRDLWMKMDETQKEIFQFHQILYGLASQATPNPSPQKIRYIVALLISDTATDMQESEFHRLLQDAGLI